MVLVALEDSDMKRLLFFLLVFMFGCATGLERRVVDLEDQMLMLQATGVGAATKMFGRDCVDSETDGCAKSMDDISQASAGDRAGVWLSSGIRAWYRYVSSGVIEDYPRQIDDDTAGGTAGWILIKAFIVGEIQFSLSDPENLPTHALRADKSKLVWLNDTGLTLNLEEIYATSDTNGYAFNLLKSNTKTDVNTTVLLDAVATSSAGTDCYYDQETTFTVGTIEDDKYLIFQHSSGTAQDLHVFIKGYLD